MVVNLKSIMKPCIKPIMGQHTRLCDCHVSNEESLGITSGEAEGVKAVMVGGYPVSASLIRTRGRRDGRGARSRRKAGIYFNGKKRSTSSWSTASGVAQAVLNIRPRRAVGHAALIHGLQRDDWSRC